jgi:uncharacterized membrane protein YsdA (DUF1294 family)
MFRIDKDRAQANGVRPNGGRPNGTRPNGLRAPRRIPEGELLLLAALGGTPGAYAARHIFRHKTRKQPFSTRLRAIAALQLAGLVALVAWFASA